MSTLRTTLAASAVVVMLGLLSAAGAGAAGEATAVTRWRITDLGTFGPAWTSGSAAAEAPGATAAALGEAPFRRASRTSARLSVTAA